MNSDKQWTEIIETMISQACDDYAKTKEYENMKIKEKEINNRIASLVSSSEKSIIDDCIFELHLLCDREGDMLYIRGMQDCIFILKKLRIL